MPTIEGICGNCQFWVEAPTKGPVTIGQAPRGFCMSVPPTPVAIIEGRAIVAQVNVRPMTLATETGCVAYFQPREELEQINSNAIVSDAGNH